MKYLLINKTEFSIDNLLTYGLDNNKLINYIKTRLNDNFSLLSTQEIVNNNIIYNIDFEDLDENDDNNLLYVYNENMDIIFNINKYKKADFLIILVQSKDEEIRIQKSLNENHILAIIININSLNISNDLNLSFIIFFINSFLKINNYQTIKWYKIIDKLDCY